MNKKYASIIIDIRHSRNYDEKQRFELQEKLYSIIGFINKYYKKEIISEFEFSSGDSIQALFENVHDAFSCYCMIKNLFYPFKIRCGIGYGKINQRFLDENYKSTNMIDGESYHLAVAALKKSKIENYCFLIYSNNEINDYFVNQIMSTIELLNIDHTERQADLFNIFNLLYPLEIKPKDKNLSSNVNFIIDQIENNVLPWDFDDYASEEVKYAFAEEVANNYTKRYIDEYKIFGNVFSTRLNFICSTLLNVSRQNIDKIRSAGKFDEIRKLEQVVLNYMKIEYKGD